MAAWTQGSLRGHGRGRASPYRVAGGPETMWLQALRSESSDSPVLCFSPIAIPSGASPSLSTPNLGLLFPLAGCVCVCGQAPLHHGFRAGGGGLPGLCSFSNLRASLCCLLFLQWFYVQWPGSRTAAPELGESPSRVSAPCPGKPLGQRAHHPGQPVHALHRAV